MSCRTSHNMKKHVVALRLAPPGNKRRGIPRKAFWQKKGVEHIPETFWRTMPRHSSRSLFNATKLVSKELGKNGTTLTIAKRLRGECHDIFCTNNPSLHRHAAKVHKVNSLHPALAVKVHKVNSLYPVRRPRYTRLIPYMPSRGQGPQG